MVPWCATKTWPSLKTVNSRTGSLPSALRGGTFSAAMACKLARSNEPIKRKERQIMFMQEIIRRGKTRAGKEHVKRQLTLRLSLIKKNPVNLKNLILVHFLIFAFSGACLLQADERRFTYTYEPETELKGGMEFEQWVTLRT